jgi:surfeit locus 1 family protein
MSRMMQEYSGKLVPYELRLAAEAPSGFARQWPEPGSGHERHLGYAWQWFAMAATVAVLYLLLNLRREEPHNAS